MGKKGPIVVPCDASAIHAVLSLQWASSSGQPSYCSSTHPLRAHGPAFVVRVLVWGLEPPYPWLTQFLGARGIIHHNRLPQSTFLWFCRRRRCRTVWLPWLHYTSQCCSNTHELAGPRFAAQLCFYVPRPDACGSKDTQSSCTQTCRRPAIYTGGLPRRHAAQQMGGHCTRRTASRDCT